MRIHIFHFLRLNVAKYVLTKIAKLKLSIRHEINQILPKPKTKKQKNKLSEDSSKLWCDVFCVCPKSPF